MNIIEITKNKKDYLDLLLLADEQEDMIDRYLERGDMYALFDGELRTIAVVTDEGGGTCELKNLATAPHSQGRGYGKAIVTWLFDHYHDQYKQMLVGTGDHPKTLRFYQYCGFTISHQVKDFFTDNYDHPIIDDGILLKDMVYLKRDL